MIGPARVCGAAALACLLTAGCSAGSSHRAQVANRGSTATTTPPDCGPAAPAGARPIAPGAPLTDALPRPSEVANCLQSIDLDRTAAYPDPCTERQVFTTVPPTERAHADFQSRLGTFVSVAIARYDSAAVASRALREIAADSGRCKRYPLTLSGRKVEGRVSPVTSLPLGDRAIEVEVVFSNGVLSAVNDIVVARVGTDVVEVVSGWALGQGIPAEGVAKLVADRLPR